MGHPEIENKDTQNLIVKFTILSQENESLRRYIGELENRLSLEEQFKCVKVGGFNYHCTDCKEKFDVPGRLSTCPHCKSIKIRVIDKT